MTYGLKEAHDELLSELEDLREKYAEVCETSAMLRADMTAARERQAKLRYETARLRALAESMYDDLTHQTFPPDWVTEYAADMRELGIEVEA